MAGGRKDEDDDDYDDDKDDEDDELVPDLNLLQNVFSSFALSRLPSI